MNDIRNLERLLSADPNNVSARKHLACLYDRSGMQREAIKERMKIKLQLGELSMSCVNLAARIGYKPAQELTGLKADLLKENSITELYVNFCDPSLDQIMALGFEWIKDAGSIYSQFATDDKINIFITILNEAANITYGVGETARIHEMIRESEILTQDQLPQREAAWALNYLVRAIEVKGSGFDYTNHKMALAVTIDPVRLMVLAAYNSYFGPKTRDYVSRKQMEKLAKYFVGENEMENPMRKNPVTPFEAAYRKFMSNPNFDLNYLESLKALADREGRREQLEFDLIYKHIDQLESVAREEGRLQEIRYLIDKSRKLRADQALAESEFFEDVVVVDTSPWWSSARNDMTCVVYVEDEDAADETPSRREYFHVEFYPDSARIKDSYGYQ